MLLFAVVCFRGEQGRYDLHDASMSGEVERVKAILEAAPDRVNARGPKNVSTCDMCLGKQQLLVCRWLAGPLSIVCLTER